MLVDLLSNSIPGACSTHKDVGRHPCRFLALVCTHPTGMLVDCLSNSIPDVYSAHNEFGRHVVDLYC
eukprot:12889736-Prorocentrum_lima.AAC.1